MIASPQINVGSSAAPAGGIAERSDETFPITLLELELSLAAFDGSAEDFRATVDTAAKAAGGELLFDLPASGLVDDCRQIAVLYIPQEDSEARKVVLALLDAQGSTIRVQEPDERTEGLLRFAGAFIAVLQRMG